jgi:hypothetical protein
LWDLLFYASFGLALTAIVSVSGVLLVFSYLVIPAVIARLLVQGVMPRLLLAWSVGLVVSILGVSVSYAHPTGPVIVTFFGIALVGVLVFYAIRKAANRAMALGQAGGVAAVLAGILWGFAQLPVAPEHHEEEATPVAVAGDGAGSAKADALSSTDPAARDAAARDALGKADRTEALAKAVATESDPSVKLTMAIVLAKGGDKRALDALVSLTTAEVPFVRMQADDALRKLAGADAPTYDPVSGPDTTGVWKTWATAHPDLPATASSLELP